MSYLRRPPTRPAVQLSDVRLTIPGELLDWACKPDQQLPWARPYGDEARALVEQAAAAPLSPDATERLLSRLEAIAHAAVDAKRSDLLIGLDLQTAEWLDLHVHVDTPHGRLHIGPDPRTVPRDDVAEPLWTYREVRIVVDAESAVAVDVACKAKALLLGDDAFPTARIGALTQRTAVPLCAACGSPATSAMMATDYGDEYHWQCWSELTSPMPEHLREILKKAPKAKQI